MNEIYFSREGRSLLQPRMFEKEHLEVSMSIATISGLDKIFMVIVQPSIV